RLLFFAWSSLTTASNLFIAPNAEYKLPDVLAKRLILKAFQLGENPSAQRGGEFAFAAATGQVVHGDVEVDFAAVGFDGQYHRFGVAGTFEAFVAGVNFGRKDLEGVALVVEKSDGISNHHVGELTNRFAGDLVVGGAGAGEDGGNSEGDLRREVEDDAAFDVSLDGVERGNSLPAVGAR